MEWSKINQEQILILLVLDQNNCFCVSGKSFEFKYLAHLNYIGNIFNEESGDQADTFDEKNQRSKILNISYRKHR
jgi:hypothetical protein